MHALWHMHMHAMRRSIMCILERAAFSGALWHDCTLLPVSPHNLSVCCAMSEKCYRASCMGSLAPVLRTPRDGVL